MKNYKTPHSKKSKTLLVVLVIALLSAVAIIIWKTVLDKPSTDAPATSNTSSDGEYLNLNPPTEEEKQQAEDNKKQLENESNQQNPPSTTASVIISRLGMSEGKVEAAGYVVNVFEEGGTCTLTLTKGSERLTGTSQGMQDVNKTTCPPINITASSGQWTATLSYSSSAIRGTSDSQVIQVP